MAVATVVSPRDQTDRVFWRIVPVGFASVLLSAALLMAVTCPGGCVAWSLTSGLLAMAIFGGVVWLPLFILWNVIVLRHAPVAGLLRAAVRTSFGMALSICLLLGLLVASTGGIGAGAIAAGLAWALATGCLAAGLTFLAFRHAAMKDL